MPYKAGYRQTKKDKLKGTQSTRRSAKQRSIKKRRGRTAGKLAKLGKSGLRGALASGGLKAAAKAGMKQAKTPKSEKPQKGPERKRR